VVKGINGFVAFFVFLCYDMLYMPSGNLFIVATPIGHFDDITIRALETLRAVDVILCEDTRVTKNLLHHYHIKTPTLSYHQHSDQKKIAHIYTLLQEGKSLALVTDAGTPGMSDPGNKLIHDLLKKVLFEQKVSAPNIIPIPGPSAAVAAISISGFPTDSFLFLGFPPHKKGRSRFFQDIADSSYTVVLYESCHRIKKTMQELGAVLAKDKKICVCRELTKRFEQIYRGTITEVNNQDIKEKGEFVIVISK